MCIIERLNDFDPSAWRTLLVAENTNGSRKEKKKEEENIVAKINKFTKCIVDEFR